MLPPLRTGEIVYGVNPRGPAHEAILRFVRPGSLQQPPPAGLDEAQPVHAEVNHGDWVVRCRWCASAQVAFVSDPRFWCIECGNAGAGGRYVPVIWPAPDVRAEIERLLGDPVRLATEPVRSHHEHRNWRPGVVHVRGQGWLGEAETPMQLELENRLRGDVPLGPRLVLLPGGNA